MLSNSPGNIGFEAAPFKLPPEYIEVLGGVDAEPFKVFRQLFREGFEAARKHCDRLISESCLFRANSSRIENFPALVELMQKGWLVTLLPPHVLTASVDSALPCFAAFGEQTANQLRDRFQPALTHSLVGDYVNGLIDSSLGSSWTRLYDSVSSPCHIDMFLSHWRFFSTNTTHSQSCDHSINKGCFSLNVPCAQSSLRRTLA